MHVLVSFSLIVTRRVQIIWWESHFLNLNLLNRLSWLFKQNILGQCVNCFAHFLFILFCSVQTNWASCYLLVLIFIFCFSDMAAIAKQGGLWTKPLIVEKGLAYWKLDGYCDNATILLQGFVWSYCAIIFNLLALAFGILHYQLVISFLCQSMVMVSYWRIKTSGLCLLKMKRK